MDGEGRVVLLWGEPGIGKSRLTAALSEQIKNEPHTRLRYFCSPHHQDSALYPFTTQLEHAAGFARDDTVEQKLGKLRELLASGAQRDEDVALLAELLSLPSTAADLNLSPQRKREMLFEALLHQLEALARSQPVLMVFEDAHWIDPTSRELLDLMIDRVRRLPMSCAQRRASRGSGANRAGAWRRGTCWRRSTAGSPKASTPPTCRRRKRCSTH
jgi:predicted ATPase